MTEALNAASAAARQELLRRRLSRRPAAPSASPAPRPRPAEAPLSHAQHRLWLDHQLDPAASRYNVPLGWWLDGPVDVAALRRAFDALVARHDILRTSYTDEDSPRQVVASPAPCDLTVTDLSDLPPAEAERRALALATAEGDRPFDLASGPVLRAALHRTSATRHLLTVTVHHIAFDGWSTAVLERELGALHHAFAAGLPNPLAPLATQYADFALEQHDEASTAARDARITYWRGQLAGLRRADIPADRTRPQDPTGACASYTFEIPRKVHAGLGKVAAEHGATLFMVLLAAYHLLLVRMTGRRDVATGSPVDNRNTTAHEALIGMFVDVIVLRSDLSRFGPDETAPTFADLLAHVRKTSLEGYGNSAASLDAVIEAVEGAERTKGVTPFFQSLFALDGAPEQKLALAGVEVTEHGFRSAMAKCDLALTMTPGDELLRGHIEYSTELFDESTAVVVAAHYRELLAAIARDPSLPLDTYGPGAPEGLVLNGAAGTWADALVARVLATGTAAVGTSGARVPAHVLDERLRPVPLGADGALYLPGPENSAARPAWAAPGLPTAPPPAPGFPALYPTGDRVRTRPDRTIEHRGSLLTTEATAPTAPEPSTVPVPPADGAPTPLQTLIAGVYTDLLGVDHIAPDADLRSAGADSLISVRVTGRLRELLDRRVELRAVVRSRTVAELAAALGEEPGAAPAAAPAASTTDYRLPLSPAQRSIWFLEKLHPGRTDYLMPLVWHLEGPLDATALRRALGAVLARHEALRTGFREVDGQPVQHVTETAAVPWTTHDLTGLAPDEAASTLRRLTDEEAARPLALDRPPLLRATLLRSGAERHTLVLVVHHIVFDGWSTSLLLSDLDAAYRDLTSGGTGTLPPLALGYRQYVQEQQRRLDGPEVREQLRELAAHLANPPRLNLPRQGRAPEPGASTGGRHSLTLSAELSEAVRTLARTANASVFTVLLAAFDLLLGRLSEQEDLLVGVPFAGRARPELDRLIGNFLNTLVIRADLSGSPSFRTLIERVGSTLTDALGSQEIPFEQVVETLSPPREIDRNPLVDVVFNFDNTPAGRPVLGGTTVLRGDVGSSDPKFWLTLYGAEQDGVIRFEWVFRTDVLGPEQIAAMSAQFAHLLDRATRCPDAPVGTYSLRAPELSGVLPDPLSPLPMPDAPSVVEQFERAAVRDGDATALTHGPTTRDYRTLLADVRDLAARIEAAVPETAVVALSVPSSFGLAAGMLGTLASRRPLLVVDPSLPEPRRDLLLREAGARLVISGSGEPTASGGLDLVPAALDGGAAPALPSRPGDRAAYLSFTSGSTGVPKCVTGSERGLAHFLDWQRTAFEVGPGDRAAQLTALSFDVLYRDVLLPLVSGATLCVPDVDTDDPDRLFAWLREQRVTLLHTVPSVARAWLAARHTDRSVESLRQVFFAGEPLTGLLVDEMRQRVTDGEIVNLYGPTETTLAKLAHRLPPGPAPRSVPVGRPLPGCQALVLSPHGEPCSVGESGEVVLRTPARSLGYLTAPDEERSRFFTSPFTGDPEDVLYRTGDRGRHLPDGTLELLGRLDGQLKVRGVRIEPGEIEAHLCRHRAVTDAAVTVLDAESGHGGELAAFLELSDDEVDATALRSFLAHALPEYLLPGAYYRVARIPTTASGKTDRRALRETERTRIDSGEQYVAPRTPTESLLVDIWRQVLGVPRLGVHDNFFERGGDSLRLVHVTSLAREHGVELQVRDHYEHQTVAELSAKVDQDAGSGPAPRSGPLARLAAGRGMRPLFWVHPSGGSIAWYAGLAHSMPAERPLLAFELPGAYGPGEPLATIEALAEEYVTHLLREQPTGPYALMAWSYGGLIALEMARLLTAAGHRVDPLVLVEPTLPQDPGSMANHRTTAELYRSVEVLVEKAAAAPEGSPERARLTTEVVDFFDAAGWPRYEAELAGVLPLRACGLLHGAYLTYRPEPYEGDIHLVVSAEGRNAGPENRSPVLHDSAERYLRGWERLIGGTMRVHNSGDDHMSMVAPGNAAHLAALCHRIAAESESVPASAPADTSAPDRVTPA
ncbi:MULTISPECIES: amino acid adenylation domain-containing protein [unclassified Streptomyces]|uniref:amino acid adenylation domain-containing protein n=1 Tax=unclassified Streptomyces TaxID=2593676 RepID=UPI0035E2F4DD